VGSSGFKGKMLKYQQLRAGPYSSSSDQLVRWSDATIAGARTIKTKIKPVRKSTMEGKLQVAWGCYISRGKWIISYRQTVRKIFVGFSMVSAIIKAENFSKT
jgi:hypothetical protein